MRWHHGVTALRSLPVSSLVRGTASNCQSMSDADRLSQSYGSSNQTGSLILRANVKFANWRLQVANSVATTFHHWQRRPTRMIRRLHHWQA